MIGNPKWFTRRKYGGWGFSPAAWQGWVYLGALIVIFLLISQTPLVPDDYKTGAMLVFGIVFSLDAIDIIINLQKDEREKVHEALAERNASWAMVAVIAAGIAYQMATGIVRGNPGFDPILIVVLFAGVVAKAATNWYLRDK